MYIFFVSLLAVAAAAPQYLQQSIHHGPDYYPDSDFYHGPGFHHNRHHQRLHDYFGDNIFDTGRFLSDLSTELRELDQDLANIHRSFPTSVSREGIEGNEYKITIPLNGFEEKDIVVKVKQGLLMVQAIHKYEETIVNNYLYVRSLPDCVNVIGSWTYDSGVLNIVFPLKEDAVVVENKIVTEAPNFEVSTESREEIEKTTRGNNEDTDVGLKRGDAVESEQEHMLQTNETPDQNVEATTYAVEIKGDVEFVQYKK